MHTRFKELEDHGQKLECILRKELEQKEQSVQLLKNILKRKIIDEVAANRYCPHPDDRKKNYGKEVLK